MVGGLLEARLRRVTGDAGHVAGGIVGAQCLRPMRDRQQGRRDRAGHEQRDGDGREPPTCQDTRRVFLLMKSIRMNCPSVIVFVK